MAHSTSAPQAAAASMASAGSSTASKWAAKLRGDEAPDDSRKRHDRVVAERAEPGHLAELAKLDGRDRGDPAAGHGSAENHRRNDERQMEGQDGTAAIALRPDRSKQAEGDPEQESGHAVIGSDVRERPSVAMPGPRGNVSVAQASAATPATIVAATKAASAGDVRRRSTRGFRSIVRPTSAEAPGGVGVGRDVASIRGHSWDDKSETTASDWVTEVRDRTALLRQSPHFTVPVASTRKYRATRAFGAVRASQVGRVRARPLPNSWHRCRSNEPWRTAQ